MVEFMDECKVELERTQAQTFSSVDQFKTFVQNMRGAYANKMIRDVVEVALTDHKTAKGWAAESESILMPKARYTVI